MTINKEKFLIKLAALSVVMTLATASLVAGTYSKYTTSMTGSDTVLIAKFAVTANGTDTSVFDFYLFDTINDTGGDLDDTDVADGLIAPGTQGSFAIELENNSDVTVNCAIVFTADKQGVPLQFSVDGDNWGDDISILNVNPAVNIINIDADPVSKTFYWRWVYEVEGVGAPARDTADTELSLDGEASPEVTATVTFEQVID